MGLQLDQVYDWIVEELGGCRSITESMKNIIDRCESAFPHPDWSELKDLPYDHILPLIEWLQATFRHEPPDSTIKALWFGLFNPINDDEAVADIYVCGSNRFDPHDPTCDWACGPDWWPDNRYANSEVLADIYRIAYREDPSDSSESHSLKNDAEYPLCLAYGAFAIRDVLENLGPDCFLRNSPSLGIAVGFDSGDFILLGELTAAGLITNN